MNKFGLIGNGLSHSYSPIIHRRFADYDYELLDIQPDELEETIRSDKYDGFNITMPYKKAALSLCDEISEEALKIGCVNTIIKEFGKLKGYNTDYFGFTYLLERNEISVEGKKCLILGDGGASKTVQTVLDDLDASEIVVLSRNGEHTLDEVEEHYDSDIVINATPVGMYPENGAALVDISKFTNCSGAIDLIYNPHRTKFIIDAEMADIPACGGLSMLVAQAKQASELFTGKKIDDDEISAAIYDIRTETLNIVMIGMPGAGKTYLGKKMAEREHRRFVDLDDLIVEKEGRSIPEIFDQEGEEYFRRIETELLKDTCKEGGLVIACGGGIVKRNVNYSYIRQNSRIIWVKRDIDKLEKRGRPLSNSMDLEDIFNERKDAYESWSDYFIDNNQDFN